MGEKVDQRGLGWVGLPVIATVAGLLCRELTLQNGYLPPVKKIPRKRAPGRVHLLDDERRCLAEAQLASRTGLHLMACSSSRIRSMLKRFSPAISLRGKEVKRVNFLSGSYSKPVAARNSFALSGPLRSARAIW
jgi:hypothetical protein